MNDCLFCKIAAGEIPSTCLYNDDDVYAFRDINPQMPVHFLVIPKQHIDSVAAITAENSAVVAKCFEVIAKLAAQEGLTGGYRVISNCGDDAGQTVHHLHFHVLGARRWGRSCCKGNKIRRRALFPLPFLFIMSPEKERETACESWHTAQVDFRLRFFWRTFCCRCVGCCPVRLRRSCSHS